MEMVITDIGFTFFQGSKYSPPHICKSRLSRGMKQMTSLDFILIYYYFVVGMGEKYGFSQPLR